MPPLPPPDIVQWSGLILLFVLGIGASAAIQEFVKRRMAAKNGNGNGHYTCNHDQKLVEKLDLIANRLRDLTEMYADMAESGERRAKKALDQHATIIEKIDDLDVPRFHNI